MRRRGAHPGPVRFVRCRAGNHAKAHRRMPSSCRRDGRMSCVVRNRLTLTALMVMGLSRPAFGQEPTSGPPSEPTWSSDLSAAWYMPRDESDFIQPTIRADRGRLHLETRYAYEDRESLSFFAGANFEFG